MGHVRSMLDILGSYIIGFLQKYQHHLQVPFEAKIQLCESSPPTLLNFNNIHPLSFAPQTWSEGRLFFRVVMET